MTLREILAEVDQGEEITLEIAMAAARAAYMLGYEDALNGVEADQGPVAKERT